jgi:hypothetical protein
VISIVGDSTNRIHWRGTMAGIPPYDWDTWLNGEVHTLHQGMDFEKDPRTMAKIIRIVARRRGMKATVHGCDGNVRFRAYTPEAKSE